MTSRSFSKALRSPVTRQLVAPVVSRRLSGAALAGVRARVTSAVRVASCGPTQQTRGVKTIDFAGHKEKVFGNVSCL